MQKPSSRCCRERADHGSSVDEVVERYNERVGPLNGARVVARAWRDPAFKRALLADGTAAVEIFAFEGGQTEKLVVVENTPKVHNVVVCTLCSCYPWAMLGLPPRWYKDPAYRSRIVREPRRVLEEFGVQLGRRRRNARVGLERGSAIPRVAATPASNEQ